MTAEHRETTEPESYFATRLTHDPKRQVLWETLSREVFSRFVSPESTVMELGAGWCDLINNLQARRRIAVDVWPGIADHADPGVETIVASAVSLPSVASASVDTVFASNLLEHLTQPEIDDLLRETKRVLTANGLLVLIQPNFRLCPRTYFDDYTHVSIWTDVGLSGFLESRGWTMQQVTARFLPLTVKSRLPVHSALIKAYLKSPVKPMAGQMLIIARPPDRS